MFENEMSKLKILKEVFKMTFQIRKYYSKQWSACIKKIASKFVVQKNILCNTSEMS